MSHYLCLNQTPANHRIMAKSFFNRYVWLIDLINRHGYITMPDINDAWRRSSLNETGEDLPERTFFNHRDAILDMFGLEIKCDRTLGYHIVNSGNLKNDGVRTWLLQSLSLNNVLSESSDMQDRILFENVPSGQRFLTELVQVMRDGKVINLTYQSFRNMNPHTFQASPYCLKMFKQRWYMLAQTPKYDIPAIYALDRIVDIEETDEHFDLPAGFNAEDFFSKFYGIVTGDGNVPEKVRLKVCADQVKYYRTLPLHHSQQETETNDRYSIFEYYVVPSFDFYQEIMSKGDLAEVLEPAGLRAWVAETAKNMVEIYKEQ